MVRSHAITTSATHHLFPLWDSLLDRQLAFADVQSRPPLTEAELADQEAQRRLLAAGVISEIKPSKRVATETERFTPIAIQGEPLSQTIIRERR